MHAIDIVRDSLRRVHDLIPAVLDGLDGDDLLWRPEPEANSMGWLIWHLTRMEDEQVSRLGDLQPVWESAGWYERFGLPYIKSAQGFSMGPVEVGLFNTRDTALLNGYAADSWRQVQQLLDSFTADDLDRVVDRRYTPPVTVGARLVSVVVETAQHVGQAGYLRGLRERAIGVSSGWSGVAR